MPMQIVCRLFAIATLAALAACAPRGEITVLPDVTVPNADQQTIFVATNRAVAPQAPGLPFEQNFGDARDPTLRFARVDVSIPPVHVTGRVEWPGTAKPDPALHFVTTNEVMYLAMAPFVRAVDAAQPPGGRTVVVFVHGFNVNQAEAVYRLAQTAHDFDAQSPVVAFSWPSAGNPRGYAYDRDSVIFSRDGLEQVLTALTARSDRRVFLAGHSMGSQLVMETLRQMSISGKGAALARLSGVALMSPDIDEDVFVQQAARIAPFPQPFTIVSSRRDRALGVAAFITGRQNRLGSITDPTRLADLPVDVIDLTDVEGGDIAGHMTALTSPEAIDMLVSLDRPR